MKLIKRIRPAIILKFLIGTAFTISLFINLNQAKASDTVVHNKGAAEDVFWVFLPLVEKEIKDPYLRKVNAPYFSDFIPSSRMAVFWFGKITPTENYADVRVGYTDTEIVINLNIIDRHLWYDSTSPEMGDLANWDAVSLYVSTDPTPGALPASSQYKFVAQLNNWQPRESYQAAYQGTGTGWIPANISFSTESAWRGPAINNNSQFDDGWSIKFIIPFESVGFNRPPHGELWRLGIVLHDRDYADNTNIADKYWPETFGTISPETWGGLHFGQNNFTQPRDVPEGVTIIKNGLQGASVKDGHVGGAFNCGENINQWTQWGEMNYENIEPTQINIQNQMDISEWPCFSKYFITFPLDQIPAGSTVISATLTMNHFGNSGIGWDPPPVRSWIQVLTVADDWTDSSITWNNAPLAYENVGMLPIEPLSSFPGWPGIPYVWEISWAVDNALQSGGPLRLALYSADGAIHSGKYFYSSDSNSDGSGRPVLHVYWRSR